MQLRRTLRYALSVGLAALGTQSAHAQAPGFPSGPGCQNGTCTTPGNPASFAPNKHLPNGCKPYCATDIYPKSELLYIKKFCGPSIIPGSCYGHFPSSWRRWEDACPGGNCYGPAADTGIVNTPYGEPMIQIPQPPMTMPTPGTMSTPLPVPNPVPESTSPGVPMPMPAIPVPKPDAPKVGEPKKLPMPATPGAPVIPATPIDPDKPNVGPGSTAVPKVPESTPVSIGIPANNPRGAILTDPQTIKPWVRTLPGVVYPPTPDR